MSRRSLFVNTVLLGLMGVAGVLVGVPVVGFVLGPVLQRTKQRWRDVGGVDEFHVGRTVKVQYEDPSPVAWAGETALTAAWLRRDAEDRFTAFSVNCSHLGCPVRWISDAELFMCPCHGGVYYADGKVAAGPPPRRLFQYPVRIRGRRVEIRTSPIPMV